MVFSSIVFLCVFLPVVFILYNVLPGIRLKNVLLIIASLIFYAYGEPIYILLMLFSTIFNWLFGLACAKPHSDNKHIVSRRDNFRKLWLIIAVIANLLFIGVFKYADMFIGSVDALTGLSIKLPGISLPIGISFYTFQALSYVIDVYRGDVKPQKNYFYVLLYISFFPQLIAGPIVKYHDIEKQLENRHASINDIYNGLTRFIVGLSKKVLIANTFATIVDGIYAANIQEINIVVAWIAAISYVMQIYFDFSAYSDMAIGMAKMFGFTFKENFNYPYISLSIKEFWRRWHISLSTWFRDYLYIPLGGNRKGTFRTCINKIIVFAACGLWHGASWTFVVWGLGHGLMLLIEEVLPIKKLPKVLGWIYTFIIVTILFVVFRADDLNQALFMIGQMFTGFHFEEQCIQLSCQVLGTVNLVTFVVACLAAFKIAKVLYVKLKTKLPESLFFSIQCILCLVLLIMCFLTLSSGGYNPFIYFRF